MDMNSVPLELAFTERGPSMHDMVKEFHDAFGQRGKDTPEFRNRVIREEVTEMAEAIEHLLKESADVLYTVIGGQVEGTQGIPQDLAEDLATMHNYMNAVFHPAIITEAFRRVHASNMSKLGEDGKPIYREDGKVLKGPNYAPPNLMDLV